MRQYFTGLRFISRNARIAFALFMLPIFLSACAGGGYQTQSWDQRPAQQTPGDIASPVPGVEPGRPVSTGTADFASAPDPQGLPPVKVAILLPLSGPQAGIGQSMLSAAQLAVFEIGHSTFQLMPKDTKGTAAGAQAAAREALRDGSRLVLGPLFAHSVRSARNVTQSANVPMIAFSTDWTLANSRTFLIGFLPFDQISRIVSYASAQGSSRIGMLSPADRYGDGVISAYKAISMKNSQLTPARIERFAPQGNDLSSVVRRFSDYDKRKAMGDKFGAPFDAVLMPVGGAMARSVGSFLSHYDMPPAQVRRLGTGLMDDPALAADPSLNGTWFAAPSPGARRSFEHRYKSTFFEKPPRIASLAYDATALAAILARSGLEKTGRPAFDPASIANPNGFAGVDGIFRFRPDGIVERGLAVLAFKNGRVVVIDEAPKTFQVRRTH